MMHKIVGGTFKNFKVRVVRGKEVKPKILCAPFLKFPLDIFIEVFPLKISDQALLRVNTLELNTPYIVFDCKRCKTCAMILK